MLCQHQDHWSARFSMRSCPERAYILAFLVPFWLSSLSMAEAPVAILPYVLEAVRPAAIPFIACVAFRLDFRADIILHFICIPCVELFYSVRRFQLLWHVSPSSWFFSACVALQLAISGVSRFHYSFMVSFLFCSPFCVHSVSRL